jgi:muramidase (phage lysozyme)
MPKRKKKGNNKGAKNEITHFKILNNHHLDYYDSILKMPNIQAYLLVIRRGETSLDTLAYYKRFNGLLLTLNVNPEISKIWHGNVKHKSVPSSAVGAYEFRNTYDHPTWPDIANLFDFKDFKPWNQDIGAVYLLDKRHAIADILKGDIVSAIKKTNHEWTSLPEGADQKFTLADDLKFYEERGGKFEYNLNYDKNTLARYSQDSIKRIQDSLNLKKLDEKDYLQYFKLDFHLGIPDLQKIQPPKKIEKLHSSIFTEPLLDSEKFISTIGDTTDALKYEELTSPGKYNNVFGVPDLVQRTSNPYNLFDAGSAFATNNSIADSLYKFKVNKIGSFYDRYSIPSLINDSSSIVSTGGDRVMISGIPATSGKAVPPGKANHNQVTKPGTLANPTHRPTINLNSAMIENFTINVKDGKDATMDLKRKVEEVLLEILNSANVI